jgi:hypothetical protein
MYISIQLKDVQILKTLFIALTQIFPNCFNFNYFIIIFLGKEIEILLQVVIGISQLVTVEIKVVLFVEN